MSSSKVQLHVKKSPPRDSGSSDALVSPTTLDELGWSAGDVVEIRGAEETVATVASSQSKEMGNRDIGLDVFIRENAGVSIGDSVEVSVIEPKNAEIIVVEVPDEIAAPDIDPELVRSRLIGNPVTKDQYVPIRLNRDNPSRSVALAIDEVRPNDVGVVSEDTDIRLNETSGT